MANGMERTDIIQKTTGGAQWAAFTEAGSPEAQTWGSEPKVHIFSALDHTLFAGMLLFSALIGIYFAFFAKQKQNTTVEYLMGGRKMGIIPVSLSLIASFVSGITLLGAPAEMYVYGTQYATMVIGVIIACAGCGVFFLPVFYGLQLPTSYEYLEVRFDRKVRLLGSLLFLVNYSLYIPIVVYLPALAFGQVTGINIHLITPLVSLVCIFYTSLGGLKAVVWTDAFQSIMMVFSMVLVIILGTYSAGGMSTVWQRNEDSGRIELLNLDLDPTVRHTFWNTGFVFAFHWMSRFSVNQGMVQRFLAIPTLRKSQIVIFIFSLGSAGIILLSCYGGLLLYSAYHDCDLLSKKVVGASDQLMLYYVMDVAGSLPGFPGLFMSGVFSASLSSMSTGLNAMTGVLYQDFIQPLLRGGKDVTEERASNIMKILCLLIGIFCVAMVFISEHLGTVIQVNGSLGGITSGPMLAIFALGMLFPWVNSKGAFFGGIAGMLVMGFISIGTHAAVAKGQITFKTKPVSTEGCTLLPDGFANYSIGASLITTDFLMDTTTEANLAGLIVTGMPGETGGEEAWPIFRISYTLYSFMGLAISIAVGLVVSFLTGPTDPADVHIDLLTPVVRPLFAHRCKSGDEAAHWKHLEKELKKDIAEANTLLKKEAITIMVNDEFIVLNDIK